jgi:hypothetical protein
MTRERPGKAEPPQILSGWKEIANYLGKGVRTVQRYERELGLPVRHPAGKPCGSVIATKAEMDAWVKASPIREAFRLQGKDLNAEYTATTEAIRKGLSEMTRLRDQMLALRREVKTAASSLRESIHELRGTIRQNSWKDSPESLRSFFRTPVEPHYDGNELQPPAKKTIYPKAS